MPRILRFGKSLRNYVSTSYGPEGGTIQPMAYFMQSGSILPSEALKCGKLTITIHPCIQGCLPLIFHNIRTFLNREF
jgi:hypothetical protein